MKSSTYAQLSWIAYVWNAWHCRTTTKIEYLINIIQWFTIKIWCQVFLMNSSTVCKQQGDLIWVNLIYKTQGKYDVYSVPNNTFCNEVSKAQN